MGARNSKLDGPAGMLKGWVTPRVVFLSHRRQPPSSDPTSKDVNLLPPPEIPTDTPIVYETNSKLVNDDSFEEQDKRLVDDKDKNIIGIDGQGDRVEHEEEEKEEGYEREDMIRRRSISPSFRVYCLDSSQSDDQEEEVEDDDDGGASVDSDPTMTLTTLSRQSSHNSNDEGLIKTPRRRRRRRRLMQKDIFNGVGKNFLNLKLPYHHHRHISTGTISDRKSHRHHFQLPRISHRKSISGSKHHDPQHPDTHEGSSHHDNHHCRHHHQLSLPNINSHQNIIDDEDDNNNNNQDPHTIQRYQANDNVNHSQNNGHHLMKLPHISHHNSNDDVNNNHRTSNVVEISNSFHDGNDNDDDNRHTYDDVVDHDHQHHHNNNHKLKLPCIHNNDDDDDNNHHHRHNHLKHVLPQVSCWRNTRRQSRRGKTRHHG